MLSVGRQVSSAGGQHAVVDIDVCMLTGWIQCQTVDGDGRRTAYNPSNTVLVETR